MGEKDVQLKPSKLEGIKQYFHDRGITAKDIPVAFLVHELIGITFATATWVACYGIQPGKATLKPLARALGRSRSRAVGKVYKASTSQAEKLVSRIPWAKGNASRLTASLAEAVIFRAVVKPITIPAKLWATWKILTVIKGPASEGSSA